MKTSYVARDTKMQSLINEGNELLQNSVGLSRYEHSVRVAETAGLLCKQYDEDVDKGYYAGLMHDLCKEMDNATLLALVEQEGGAITALEKEKPALVHGRAAAVYLQTKLLVTDEQIVEAVRHHTFGFVSMCNIAKIVYVADKIEPGRPYDTQRYYNLLDSVTLNGLTACVAADNIAVLEKKGRKVSSLSQAFLLSVRE